MQLEDAVPAQEGSGNAAPQVTSVLEPTSYRLAEGSASVKEFSRVEAPCTSQSEARRRTKELKKKLRKQRDFNRRLQRRLQRKRQALTIEEIVRSVRLHVSPPVAALLEAQLRMKNGQHVDEAVATQQEKAEDTAAVPNAEVKSLPELGATSTPPEPEGMDTHTGLANLQAGKRPHDQANSLATLQDSNGGDEPPPKTPGMRRPTLKLRPNITDDPRQAGKPPP
ncbi:hypothetical protein HPB49_010614 [Dermacentor silvarum]|uniref:Uncharacterized protein n=1 Tax=Dermacentor silvarum TaxID=543639 RepID=A0ACB8DYT8_DERSI|nr:hypothetical protein HPB49_010614 [Dermacentor silvarum]